MNTNIIPKDSHLLKWVRALSALEAPTSYIVTVGLSAIGAALSRNCWVDQSNWKVYPNLSCFLVGPSGLGKDTVYNQGVKLLAALGILIVAGRTTEYMADRLVRIGTPARAVILASEATAFFGKKEYQSGKVEFITELLSTGDWVDVSSKSEGERRVEKPTITCWFGSTAPWLQRNMPSGTMEGGFFPRFLIVNEDMPRQQVPWIKFSSSKADITSRASAEAEFCDWMADITEQYHAKPQEIVPLNDAIDYYANWYYNRFSYFSANIREYANRSRDQMLRIAMLMAVSRDHTFIEKADLEFAAKFVAYLCATIEGAIKPMSDEQRCQDAYLNCLPATSTVVFEVLRSAYDNRTILAAQNSLILSGKIKKDPQTKEIVIQGEGE